MTTRAVLGAPDDDVLLSTRPGVLFVLRRPTLILIILGGFVVAWWLSGVWRGGSADRAWLWYGVLVLLGWLLYRIVDWRTRRYILTARTLTVEAGLIRRVAAAVPLRNVQHVTLTRSLIEQLAGLGTVGAATAGSDGAAVHWLMVPRSVEALAAVRLAVDRAQSDAVPGAQPGLVVIGLAGGIGSGKSEVGRILAGLGCVVIDSDREAREALDRPEIRATLVQWWGDKVLSPDGRINRHAVAEIVFGDASQRERLERLVHPIVRTARAEIRRRAEAAGARAVVVDAPLLFEAGVDQECDTVLFVDAPRDVRLERVRRTRNWDEAELDRREAAQLPLEEKRRRSASVVVNDGSLEALTPRVKEALKQILDRARA